MSVSEVSAALPQFSHDPMAFFPSEIAIYILSFLQYSDLAYCSIVSRNWKTLSEDSSLWKAIYLNDRGNIPQKTNNTTHWKTEYKKKIFEEFCTVASSLPSFLLLKTSNTIKAIAVSAKYAAAACTHAKKGIEVWDLETNKSLGVIGWTQAIYLRFCGENLFSVHQGGTLAKWNINGKLLFSKQLTPIGTEVINYLFPMQMTNKFLVCGSGYVASNIYVYEMKPPFAERVLHCIDSSPIMGYEISGTILAALNQEGNIGFWDLKSARKDAFKTLNLRKIFPEIMRKWPTRLLGFYPRFKLDANRLVIRLPDRSFKIWNRDTEKWTHSLVDPPDLTGHSILKFKKNLLVTSHLKNDECRYSVIHIWDIRKKKIIRILPLENDHFFPQEHL